MKAFSFIPFLEIWTISNHTGIGDRNVHACRIYIYIDGLAWGVVLSRVMGLSRTSKTDNSNSPTFSFYINISCRDWGKINHCIMKRILMFLMSIIMTLTVYAQNSTSVKAFTYPDYLCPNPYTGKPMYSGKTIEISYSSKMGSYGIDFKYGYLRYMLSLKYKGMVDGKYIYTGFEIDNMVETVVRTSVKLSRFLNNHGQIQDGRFEEDKLIEVHIARLGSLSIYPIKDTPERRKKIEEEKQNEEKQRIAEEKAKSILEKLLPIGQKSLKDSVRQDAIVEFFSNGGKVGGNIVGNTYVAVIDTTLQVTIIKRDDDICNETLYNEWLYGKPEYGGYSRYDDKVINGKVFFSNNFNFDNYIEIQEHECSVRYDKKHDSYVYYEEPYRTSSWNESSQIEAPNEIKGIVENGIKKKGIYSLYWSTLGGKLVSLSYIKHGFVENNYKTGLYSIYK